MGVGPIDIMIIGFPGNKFGGQIAPAVMELVETGTIRVIDPAALLVAFENAWAEKFVDACRAADDFLIDQIRIPADVVEAVVTVGLRRDDHQAARVGATPRTRVLSDDEFSGAEATLLGL
jgi:hypothetical protein